MSQTKDNQKKGSNRSGRLSDDEVKTLAKRMESGDIKARDLLLLSHIPLVKYLANHYALRCQGNLYDDLYQEGCVGMIEALSRYDFRRDVPLSTYASYYIIKRIKDYIRNQDLIKLPEEIYYLVQKYLRERYYFLQKHGREASTEELSKILSLPIKKVEQLKQRSYSYVRLDHPFEMSMGENRFCTETLHNVVIPPGSVMRPVEAEVLLAIGELDLADLDVRLTKRESEVLRRKLGLTKSGVPETFPMIAKQIGVSRESVRLSYHAAVKKIRAAALEHGYTMENFPIS